MSDLCTNEALRNLCFCLVFLCANICEVKALERFNCPAAVLLSRLAARLCVFILGMIHFLLYYQILFFIYWVKHNEHLTSIHFRFLPNSCNIFAFFSKFF